VTSPVKQIVPAGPSQLSVSDICISEVENQSNNVHGQYADALATLQAVIENAKALRHEGSLSLPLLVSFRGPISAAQDTVWLLI